MSHTLPITCFRCKWPMKKQYQKQWKSMLHLAITYRKRTYIIEFGTLDNCKIILTQHICSAECIHTLTTSAYIIILPSSISYLNSSYNIWINISPNITELFWYFCVCSSHQISVVKKAITNLTYCLMVYNFTMFE